MIYTGSFARQYFRRLRFIAALGREGDTDVDMQEDGASLFRRQLIEEDRDDE